MMRKKINKAIALLAVLGIMGRQWKRGLWK